MPMKNCAKLLEINRKIDELQKAKNLLEEEFVEDMSMQIAKILLKKKAFDIDKSDFLKAIELIIMEMLINATQS